MVTFASNIDTKKGLVAVCLKAVIMVMSHNANMIVLSEKENRVIVIYYFTIIMEAQK